MIEIPLVMAVVVLVAAAALSAYISHRTTRARDDRIFAEQVQQIRKDSNRRSRSTIKGQIAEHMAPLLPEFPFNTGDARFLGSPIDYIVFEDYTLVQNGDSDELSQVVFVEVKHGRAGLSKGERRIRDCINAGRVKWELIRIPDRLPEVETA